MRLAELVARLPGAEISGDAGLEITAVTHDSRRSGPGTLFVGIRGLVTDGTDFAEAARKKGAVAICSEEPPRGEGTWVRVKNAREALALFSAAVLGDPARSLDLVGVTGTNGKTTTSYLIDSALRAAGESVGLVGTVEYRVGNRIAEAVRTTPESSDLQALLREMVDAGVPPRGARGLVALARARARPRPRVQGRGLHQPDARPPRLPRRHGRLLRGQAHALREAAAARRPRDPEPRRRPRRGARARRAAAASGPTRSRTPRRTSSRRSCASASTARACARARPRASLELESALVGRFNVQNVLAALGAGLALGLPPDAVQRGIATLPGVPGRMEKVAAGQDFTVLVDYAHTDDALKNLLETVRGLGPRRVITVFGCGGDRDRTKRPLMGAVAARLSDVVILTSDNPRSEPPEAILDEIRRGIPAARAQDTLVIPDRRDAIARALEMGREGVVVVIAGKGHETYQVLRERTRAVRRPPGGARRARPPRRGGREEVSAVMSASGLSLERVLEATAGRLRRSGAGRARAAVGLDRLAHARAGRALRRDPRAPLRRARLPGGRAGQGRRGRARRARASQAPPPGLALVRVADTTRALAQLARHVRRATSVPVVAVTGSVGKTTTKDMTAELLGTRGPVLKTEGNLNNQYGLPLTLLRLTDEHSAAVLELGMSAAGELRALAAVAEPDVAIDHAHRPGAPRVLRLARRDRATPRPRSWRGSGPAGPRS